MVGSTALMPKQIVTLALMLAAWSWCGAATAFAQNRRAGVYAIGGAAVFSQDGVSGESPQTYQTAPGGDSRGWMVGGGIFVTRLISADVEWSSTGWMEAREPSRYGMTFNERRRDRLLSVGGRFHLPRTAAVRIEPVAALVLTFPQATSQTEYDRFWLTPQQALEIGPIEEHQLSTAVGLSFGCDVRIGGRRAALLPSFRLSRTGAGGGSYIDGSPNRDITAIYPGGYPEWTTRVGAAIRLDF
jgi:hypothetical protein